jgi:translation initiation factor 2B subunit (eIF-2B alpha/beta/delta family)
MHCLWCRHVFNTTWMLQIIRDYETPPQKEFSRGLEAELQPSVAFLDRCRPLSVSMTNALRHLTRQLTQLPNSVSDAEVLLYLYVLLLLLLLLSSSSSSSSSWQIKVYWLYHKKDKSSLHVVISKIMYLNILLTNLVDFFVYLFVINSVVTDFCMHVIDLNWLHMANRDS